MSGLKNSDPASDLPDDVALMLQIGTGDRASFEEFYRRHVALVFSTAFKILNNSNDAEDVTQEVMFMVWEKSPMYEVSRGKPLNWAVTMTRNKAIDRLRSIQRRLRLNDDAEREIAPLPRLGNDRPSDHLDSGEKQQIVRSAVMKLNREQRQVIEMSYFGGLTQLEISNRLNTPLGTIKARIRRGMLRLKKIVGPAL
ncbi:MAG: sigma-70 family RNA polymerase sigma factor [Spartobacteria bacterium]